MNTFNCDACGAKGGIVGLVRSYKVGIPNFEAITFAKSLVRGGEPIRAALMTADVPSRAPFENPDAMATSTVETYRYDWKNDEGTTVFSQLARYEDNVQTGITAGIYDRERDLFTPSILVRPNILYRTVKGADTVVFVQGPRCVDSISAFKGWPEEYGVVQVTTSGGALSFQGVQKQFVIDVKGKRLIIVPSKDGPGRRYANSIVKACFGVAKEVRVVNLPNLGEGRDVADFIENDACIVNDIGDGDQYIRNNDPKRFLSIFANAPVIELLPEHLELEGEDERDETGRIMSDEGVSCYTSLRTYDLLNDKPQDFIIDHFLSQSGNTISSAPGVAKTHLACAIAYSVITGKPLAGHFKVNERMPVLFLCPEATDGQLLLRIKAHGLDKIPDKRYFRVRTMDDTFALLDDPDLLEAVRRMRPLVIIDTFSRFVIGDENQKKDVMPLIRMISGLQAAGAPAVLQLSHVPKAAGKTFTTLNMVTGSVAIAGDATNGLVLLKTPKSTKCDFTVLNAKARDSETFAPIHLRAKEFNKERFELEYVVKREAAAPEIEDPWAVKLKLLDDLLLRDPTMSISRLSKELNIDRSTVRNWMKRSQAA